MEQKKKDHNQDAKPSKQGAEPSSRTKIEEEASGWAKMLHTLRSQLKWRIHLVNGNRFIYRKTDTGYFETLVGPGNPKDTLKCKMEIRTHFRNVTPSLIDNLFNAILQEEHRLIDGNLFVEARKQGIPFLNGVFDFGLGRLRGYQPSDYYCDPIPHPFVERLNRQTVTFFRGCVRSWVGPRNTQWMVDLMAYFLFLFPNVENIWANPFGGGRNGKSTFISLLEQLLGKSKSIGINLGDLNRHTSASFIGKALIVGRDSDQFVSKRGISLIKNYSGDKYVIVEPKGGFQYDALVEGKMVVSTNYLVRSKDRSFGWYRRLLPIPFPNKFPQDSTFEDRLFSHIPGILTYLVHRAWKYKRHMVKKLTERIPRDIQVLRLDTLFLNDRVAAFWDLEFFDDDGEPVVDSFLTLHEKNISVVWGRFKTWHETHFGDDEKVEPGRNAFCGAHGHFMEKAGEYFAFSRGRKGAVITIHADVLDAWTKPPAPEPEQRTLDDARPPEDDPDAWYYPS